MLVPLLALQLAAVHPTVRDTATYATPAVRALVEQAARRNALVPPTLGRYRASLESEISYGVHAGEREMSASLEQVASELTWARTGDFEQHVVGYRSQTLGFNISTIGLLRNSWAIPSLYGNRMSLLIGVDTTRRRRPQDSMRVAGSRQQYIVVHPLATDRERYYRYSGGDTVERLVVNEREIRIARIMVEPKDSVPRGTFFSGEVDLDLARMTVVRMRGSFTGLNVSPGGPLGILKLAQLSGVIFVELVNAEIEQEYWLPSYQRFEAQAMAATMGESKAVFRIVSRFRDYVITPPESTTAILATDTLRARPHPLTLTTRDSMARFGAWRDEIGAASAPLSAVDFDSVGPPQWRPWGPPVFTWGTERLSDLGRYNRIEGLFAGFGASVRMRDLAPGVTARIVGGWAWNERTARGRVSVQWKRGAWTHDVRAGRSLDLTNDFRNPLDSGSSVGAVFGIDDYDYVDRWFAGASTMRSFAREQWSIRLETGFARDRAAEVHVMRSPIGSLAFLPNRGIDAGDYLRSTFALRWHPNVSAEFIGTGVGATLMYTRGDGDLAFQRSELTLNARKNAGPWTFASRLDAGAITGTPPPQELFELGREQNLPGYDYKEFAGDQAAVLRGVAMYRPGILTAPVHLWRGTWLPEPSPALAVSIQGGWTGASSAAARAAISRLGPRLFADSTSLALQRPASVITGDARATVAAGLRLFGGSMGLMMARAVDHNAPWRFVFSLGQSF